VNIAPESYLFTLDAGRDFPRPRPGQFVNVAASEELALRRPFSVAGVPKPGKLELLVELRGKGTRGLAARRPGETVSILGPLGNAFREPAADEVAVIVAGGIGVAGLRLLAMDLREEGHEVLTLVGARTRATLLDHLLPPPTTDGRARLEVATDDGSAGFEGTVCELLDKELETIARPHKNPARVYVCGPPPMIKEAAGIALRHGVPCQVLLEEIMACGVGACRGCVVLTHAGYKTVCSDGPVFDAEKLVFEEAPGTEERPHD